MLWTRVLKRTKTHLHLGKQIHFRKRFKQFLIFHLKKNINKNTITLITVTFLKTNVYFRVHSKM